MLWWWRVGFSCVCADHAARLCVPFDASKAGVLQRSASFLPEPGSFVDTPPRDADADLLHARLKLLGQQCHRPFLPVGGTNAFGSHLNALVYP